MSYANGFEDACELCLCTLDEEKDLVSARERIEYYLTLAKEVTISSSRRYERSPFFLIDNG
jgi:hypothetical protein